MFTVSGQTNNVPGICGTNTNQHSKLISPWRYFILSKFYSLKLVYLDMTPGNSQFNLNMLLTGTNTSRSWKIRISQIPCGATYAGTFRLYSTVTRFRLSCFNFCPAPAGCLQYFTTSVGTFSSFNYQFSNTPPVQQIANQDYTICIRMNQVKTTCQTITLQWTSTVIVAGILWNLLPSLRHSSRSNGTEKVPHFDTHDSHRRRCRLSNRLDSNSVRHGSPEYHSTSVRRRNRLR